MEMSGEDYNPAALPPENNLVPIEHVTVGVTEWHCATSREVAGSVPDGAFGIFLRHNPSGPGVRPSL